MNTLWIISFVLLLFLTLRFVTKVAFKIILFFIVIAGVVGLLYFLQLGPFQKKSISMEKLHHQYCKDSTSALCQCFVKVLEHDLLEKASKISTTDSSEKREMGQTLVSLKIMHRNRTKIKQCLQEKGKEHLYKEFIRELNPSKNKD